MPFWGRDLWLSPSRRFLGLTSYMPRAAVHILDLVACKLWTRFGDFQIEALTDVAIRCRPDTGVPEETQVWATELSAARWQDAASGVPLWQRGPAPVWFPTTAP